MLKENHDLITAILFFEKLCLQVNVSFEWLNLLNRPGLPRERHCSTETEKLNTNYYLDRLTTYSYEYIHHHAQLPGHFVWCSCTGSSIIEIGYLSCLSSFLKTICFVLFIHTRSTSRQVPDLKARPSYLASRWQKLPISRGIPARSEWNGRRTCTFVCR